MSDIEYLFPSWSQATDGFFTERACELYPVAAALCSGSPMGYWMRYAGWTRDPLTRLRRLVMLVSFGVGHELQGETMQADFFWRQAYRALASIVDRPAFWASAAAALSRQGTEIDVDGQRLRDAIVSELFAAAHASLYRSLIRQEEYRARAGRHLDFLIRLRRDRLVPDHDAFAALLAEQRDRALGQGRWAAAVECGDLLVREFSDRPGVLLACARAHYLRALDAVGKDAAGEVSVSAAIARLAELQRLAPSILQIDLWTANLHELHTPPRSTSSRESRASRAETMLRAALETAPLTSDAVHPSAGGIDADLPPMLPVSPAPGDAHDVPFSFWLWAREDKRIKFQLATAVIVALLAGGCAIREHSNRRVRARSYSQLTEAVGRQDYTAALEAAETFLSSTILAADSRADEVRRLYAEALVRWFAAEPGTPSADNRRLLKYRQLTPTR